MQSRRTVVVSFAGALAAVPLLGAKGETPAPSAPAAPADAPPKPKLVPGKPPHLDYGEGVLVPCDKGAFLTLWEGQTFWLTFGFGTSPRSERAKGVAVHHAIGAMKYLLLTMAFAPERLKEVDGHGWRQKVEDPNNYVLGELELPGHPDMPMTDGFLGFGNADAMGMWGGGGGASIGPSSGMPGSGMGATTGMNSSAMLTKVNAFCSYVVKKKDLSLADVQSRAKEVQI